MPFPRLYAILDVEMAERAGWSPADLADAYLAGGARLLQLRAKSLSGGALLDLAAALAEAASAAGGRLIVNDRADVAALAHAHGVHVGQDDLPAEDVRRIVGDDMLVGVSTHTPAQVESAICQPISYLAVGPVFATRTKETGYQPVGLDLVRHASGRSAGCKRPVVAIGGITLDAALGVIEAGASAVAVITALLGSDPEARVRTWVSALGS